MKTLNRFYTYAYLREDRTPYYIGKGSGRRVYENKGRPCNKPPKDRIIFLKQNLTEEEAFKHEIYMIAVFGRKDLGTGILYNKTDGGDGVSGWIVSEETRRKQSVIKKGKLRSQKSRKKQSEAIKGKNNHSYGKKWWNDGCGNNKRSVECPGEGWILGQSEEHKRKNSEAKKGKNNSNYGKSHSTEAIRKMSEMKKGKNNPNYGKTGKNNHNYEKKWWNDSKGNTKMSVECPGEGWIIGRGSNYK